MIVVAFLAVCYFTIALAVWLTLIVMGVPFGWYEVRLALIWPWLGREFVRGAPRRER